MFIKNPGQANAVKMFISGAREFLLAAGSRSGKTFITIYVIIVIALKFPGSRHLMARKHFNHAKGSIWLDTLPKVIEICFPELKGNVKYNNTDYFLVLPNDSEIWVAGLDDKERVDKILGREYLTIFLNECSEMTYDVYTTVKSRLAQLCSYVNAAGKLIKGKNMMFLDENPTSSKHWSKVLFVDKIDPESRAKVPDPDRYQFMKINPQDNVANISEDYIKMLEGLPPAKRKRFLDGEFGDGSQHALWSYDMINRNRVTEQPRFKRIVVAVDPAVTAIKDESDETGIVVAGISWDDHLYLLEDLTGTYTPTEWANVTAKAYYEWNAVRVIGEVNQGGDMVEAMLRTVAPNIPFTGIHATVGKYSRAEPVAALYEQNKAHHVGIFPDMEEQQTNWEGKKGEKSPNNIDALVWAAADLFPEIGVNTSGKIAGSFSKAMRGQR